MGSDAEGWSFSFNVYVSTHAPAWGATRRNDWFVRLWLVSTHAPAWGATTLGIQIAGHVLVSTHAPAWGATVKVKHINDCIMVSTHAPAWGATSIVVSNYHNLQFQPTLPHGERREGFTTHIGSRSFNPRSRMGSDIYTRETVEVSLVSTHAPAWGATRTKCPSQV